MKRIACLLLMLVLAAPAQASSISFDYTATTLASSGSSLPVGSMVHIFEQFSYTGIGVNDYSATGIATLQYGLITYTFGNDPAQPTANFMSTARSTIIGSPLSNGFRPLLVLGGNQGGSDGEFLNIPGLGSEFFNVSGLHVSTVPLPSSVWLFALALLALGAFGYAKKPLRTLFPATSAVVASHRH